MATVESALQRFELGTVPSTRILHGAGLASAVRPNGSGALKGFADRSSSHVPLQTLFEKSRQVCSLGQHLTKSGERCKRTWTLRMATRRRPTTTNGGRLCCSPTTTWSEPVLKRRSNRASRLRALFFDPCLWVAPRCHRRAGNGVVLTRCRHGRGVWWGIEVRIADSDANGQSSAVCCVACLASSSAKLQNHQPRRNRHCPACQKRTRRPRGFVEDGRHQCRQCLARGWGQELEFRWATPWPLPRRRVSSAEAAPPVLPAAFSFLS